MQNNQHLTNAMAYFAETDAIVTIFINFTDHGFECQMCLRRPNLLHHPLQFLEIYELVLVRVKTV